MTKQLKEIEIPFGAKDSELCGWEYTIPEGMEATIVDNKIIVKKKESKDERIRKELIFYFGDMPEDTELRNGVTNRDVLVWLERHLDNIAKEVIKDKDAAISFLKSCGIMNENGELADEYKIDEDNVEPKFKVGDWITDGNITIQIEAIKNDCYLYLGDCVLYSTITADKVYHLWTIRDAKDGDVLVSQYDKPFIYNGNYNSFYVGSYCGISTESRFNIATEKCRWTENMNIHPATQKQCDFLFQKMHKAGYEWDVEKKELKKIEHKHTCKLDNSYACVIFPFKVKVKSSGKIVTIYDGQLSQDGKEWIKYQSDAEDRYKIYEPNNLELVCEIEPTSTWSEEDEDVINHLLAICAGAKRYRQFAGCLQEDITKYQTWLKSLKERVQIQNK